MKRIATLLLAATLVCGSAYAQKEKVVESSAKKAPAWLGLSTSDYFCVSATAQTLEDAQKMCMNDIRQYIINAIAVNITSAETSYQNQVTRDGVAGLLESYASQTDTRSANIPYLSGLSLSNADAIYWERRMVKGKDKSYYYVCNVKYPFTEDDRSRAIAAFRKIDDKYNSRLEALRRDAEQFTDISTIGTAVNELNQLIAYFFDDVRKEEAKALQAHYRKMNEEIAVAAEEILPGQFRYRLSLHGRTVVTDQLPRLKSDYALNMRVMRNGDEYALLYDEEGVEGEENTIEMRYSFGGRSLKYTVTFDPMRDKVLVRPVGEVLIDMLRSDGETAEWEVAMQLRSRTGNRFAVRAAEVRVAELMPLRMETDEQSFEGRGEHRLRFRTAADRTTGRATLLAEITVRIYNPATRTESDAKYILPYKITELNNQQTDREL